MRAHRFAPTAVLAALAAVVTLAVAVAVPVFAVPASAGPDCSQPTVQALVAGEAAVSRPVIASPGEYALSNAYSLVEVATKPQFTYAEAGPQYAGAFEALLPAGSPTLVRAVSAFPSEDIPDENEARWGGTSRTRVTANSASSASTGLPLGELSGITADSARSWVTATVECDVVTVLAGWEMTNVVVVPGVGARLLGESLTLVVGPDGASASVDTTLVGAEGIDEVPVEGRPTDPFTDPMAASGGPRVDVGEPRTHTDATGASASGGGFNFLLTDPDTGQGAGFRIGSINADIKILGTLSSGSPRSGGPNGADDGAEGSGVGLDRAVTGSPPPVSPTAVAAAREVVRGTEVSSIVTTERSWFWPLAALAAALLVVAAGGLGLVDERRFPTLAWIVRRADRLRSRFTTVYLRW